MHAAGFQRLVQEGPARAGVDRQGLSFYSLRHTFAAKLASAGTPLQAIAHQMGHTDLRTTQKYAHLMRGALSGAVQALTIEDESKPKVVDGDATPTVTRKKPTLKIVRS